MIWLTLKNGKGARLQTNLLNDKGKNHTISLILDFVCLHLLAIHLFVYFNQLYWGEMHDLVAYIPKNCIKVQRNVIL